MVKFNVNAAITTLQRQALAAGALPNWKGPTPTALQIAEAHLHESKHACKKDRCRTAGLCLALYELIQYQAEAKDPDGVIKAANETETMRKALQKAGDRYVRTLEILLDRTEQGKSLGRPHGRSEPARGYRAVRIATEKTSVHMTELLGTLIALESRLRGRVWSFALQQSQNKKPADLLLSAVYQHLHWGGFSYREIAQLVPDGMGNRGASERVRKRCGRADRECNARSLLPSELLKKREAFWAEQRAKQVSSS